MTQQKPGTETVHIMGNPYTQVVLTEWQERIWLRCMKWAYVNVEGFDIAFERAMWDWLSRNDPSGTGQAGKRRRTRMSAVHLARVVAVYKGARENGEPPSRAVANHFSVPYSTATRWVGAARKRGLLPPTKSGSARG